MIKKATQYIKENEAMRKALKIMQTTAQYSTSVAATTKDQSAKILKAGGKGVVQSVKYTPTALHKLFPITLVTIALVFFTFWGTWVYQQLLIATTSTNIPEVAGIALFAVVVFLLTEFAKYVGFDHDTVHRFASFLYFIGFFAALMMFNIGLNQFLTQAFPGLPFLTTSIFLGFLFLGALLFLHLFDLVSTRGLTKCMGVFIIIVLMFNIMSLAAAPRIQSGETVTEIIASEGFNFIDSVNTFRERFICMFDSQCLLDQDNTETSVQSDRVEYNLRLDTSRIITTLGPEYDTLGIPYIIESDKSIKVTAFSCTLLADRYKNTFFTQTLEEPKLLEEIGFGKNLECQDLSAALLALHQELPYETQARMRVSLTLESKEVFTLNTPIIDYQQYITQYGLSDNTPIYALFQRDDIKEFQEEATLITSKDIFEIDSSSLKSQMPLFIGNGEEQSIILQFLLKTNDYSTLGKPESITVDNIVLPSVLTYKDELSKTQALTTRTTKNSDTIALPIQLKEIDTVELFDIENIETLNIETTIISIKEDTFSISLYFPEDATEEETIAEVETPTESTETPS